MTEPASELLFHHYDASPFSEKIRLCFGHKGLDWRSVVQPQIMPKPHLLPLTGGYRRIPVLQIGADVYCDSQVIARVLEQRCPEPTLFPAGSEGLCFAVGFWADRLLFQAAVPVLFSRIGPAVPEAFIEDRRQLMGGHLDFRAVMKAGPLVADQLRAHVSLLEDQLRDGRTFLLGSAFSLADASACHPVWFLLGMPPTREILDEFPGVRGWAERVRAVGHGRRSECAPDEALRIASASRPRAAPAPLDERDPNGLAPGMRVRVVPDDYGFDPVEGELVASSPHEVAVLREAPEVGEVVVHFPRAGFRVTAF
jgi:glutathione S-transferase